MKTLLSVMLAKLSREVVHMLLHTFCMCIGQTLWVVKTVMRDFDVAHLHLALALQWAATPKVFQWVVSLAVYAIQVMTYA